MTEFEYFFLHSFQRQLDAVADEPGILTGEAAGMTTMSWDRKAAFLLWNAQGRPGAMTAPDPAPVKPTIAAVPEPDALDDVLG